MSEPDAFVFIVDDDASVRNALGRLTRSVDLQCELFSSTDEFLQRERVDAPSCLVLDVRLPAKSGLDLQRELAEKKIHIPVVFVTVTATSPWR
jgi:FixJ family two-component response regulator